MVAKVENFVVDEYRKGGITAQAKDQIDNVLDSLRRVREGNGAGADLHRMSADEQQRG